MDYKVILSGLFSLLPLALNAQEFSLGDARKVP